MKLLLRFSLVSLAFLVISSLLALRFVSDPCDILLFFREGASTTMSIYGADNKLSGTIKNTYQKIRKSGNVVSTTVESENFDKKGKSVNKGNYDIRCESGSLYFDLKMMLPQQQSEALKDMQMKVEGAELQIPSELTVGQSLPDAEMRFSFQTKNGNPIPMMDMEMKITNRKVEAKEKVESAAGSFDCYRISETINMKSIFSVSINSKSWFNPEVGTVKTESYRENGKFNGRTELSEIKR